MANRQLIWDTFYHVSGSTELPEYLQKIANEGKGPAAKSAEDPAAILNKAKSVALEILSKTIGAPWKEAKADNFQLERISYGFTNLVFKSTLKDQKSVIMKVEFPKPEGDKEREYEIAQLMADNGLGPKILGFFDGGRIEEHLDSRIETEEEMRDSSFSHELGKKIAEIHNLPLGQKHHNEVKGVFLDSTRVQLVTILRSYLERVKKTNQSIFQLKTSLPIASEEFPPTITIKDLEEEINKIEEYTNKKFGTPIHINHGDLFLSNVLVLNNNSPPPTAKDIVLIDYEFSMRCHRILDIVGFCRDFSVDPFREVSQNPDERDFAFCKGYLSEIYKTNENRLDEINLTGNLEKDTEMLLKEVDDFWPIVVFFWGLWHIVCVVEENTQLDYEVLYRDKMAFYYAFKHF